MVEFKPGMLARILTTFKRWLSAEEGRVALPDVARTAPAEGQGFGKVDAILAAASSIAAVASAPDVAAPRQAPAFHLPARLHSVAKLNPRKDRARAPSPGKRPGKPVAPSKPLVRSKRDTRHVWLQTRATAPVARSTGATIHQLPAPKATSRSRKTNDVRRAA